MGDNNEWDIPYCDDPDSFKEDEEEERDDEKETGGKYMGDPEAKTLKGMIRACLILDKHTEEEFPFSTEHDCIYVQVDWDTLSREEQKELVELGWHRDGECDNCCAYYT